MGTAAGALVTGCAGAKWETERVKAEDGVVKLDLKDHPVLATPGGMMSIQPPGHKGPLLVMRIENDQFRVMSLRCPHLGCTIRWNDEEQVLRCPCHGSRFDDTGRVIAGPAKKSLPQYRAALADGTQVFIRIDKPI